MLGTVHPVLDGVIPPSPSPGLRGGAPGRPGEPARGRGPRAAVLTPALWPRGTKRFLPAVEWDRGSSPPQPNLLTTSASLVLSCSPFNPRATWFPGLQAACPTPTPLLRAPQGAPKPAGWPPSWTTLFIRPLCAPGRAGGTCLPHLSLTVPPLWALDHELRAPTPAQASRPVRFPIPGSPLDGSMSQDYLIPTHRLGNAPHRGPLSKKLPISLPISPFIHM